MTTKHLSVLAFAAVGNLLLSLSAVGASDNLLKLNGTFQGVPDGAETAPGWSIAKGRTGAVCSRISVAADGTGTLKLRADEQDSVGAYTPLFPVTGNVLEVEFEVQGIGSGTNLGYGEYIVGYQGFDASKKHVRGADGLQKGTLYPVARQVRCYLPLREGVKYFRFCLVACPGATAKFGKLFVWLNQDSSQKPVPAQPTAPAIPFQPMTAANASAKPSAPVSLTDLPFLLTEYRYTCDELKPAYQIAVPLGDRIGIELEEDSHRGALWSVHSYNADLCRIRMEHSRLGVASLRRDTAKITLEALKQGTTNVIFVHSSGKKLTLRFMVK